MIPRKFLRSHFFFLQFLFFWISISTSLKVLRGVTLVQRNLNIIFFSSTTEISRSSKHLTFRSLQIHHIKHKSVILHTSKMLKLPTWPLQLANNSFTLQGITQSTPKWQKIELHKYLVISQWRRRWSMDSPFFSHIQHQSTTMTFHFLGLSKDKIFPNAAVHTKNA